jgi:uncharacterized membrane protein
VKRRLDYLIAAVIFIAALFYYWRQICPTYYFWDSAELAAAIASGGIPHPPGFPLYLILAKIFCWLVPYDIGFASGLFSAVAAAASIALFYLACQKLLAGLFPSNKTKWVVSLGGSVLLAMTTSMTAQATRAEVYSLNLLLFILAIYFLGDAIASRNTDDNRGAGKITLACLFLGMGMANHHLTIILTLPALVYLAISMKFNYKIIAAGIAALIAPLGLYGYLAALAMKSPAMNWGNPANPAGLIAVFTGKGFNASAKAFAVAHLFENYGFDLSLLYRQLGPISAVLALVGIYSGWKANRRLSLFLIICVAFNLLSTVFNEYYYYENADIHGYLLISLICAVIFSLIGLLAIADKIQSKYLKYQTVAVLAIAVAIPTIANYGAADLSGNYSAKKLAESLVEDCPDNTLVVTSSYNSYFIIKALQEVYGIKRGILVCNVYLFGQGWYRETLGKRCNLQRHDFQRMDGGAFYRALINLFKDSSEIYIEYDAQSAPVRNYLMPSGLLMKFNNRAIDWDKIDKAVFVENDLKNFDIFVNPGMDYELLKSVMLILDNRRDFFMTLGQSGMAEKYLNEIEEIAASTQR